MGSRARGITGLKLTHYALDDRLRQPKRRDTLHNKGHKLTTDLGVEQSNISCNVVLGAAFLSQNVASFT